MTKKDLEYHLGFTDKAEAEFERGLYSHWDYNFLIPPPHPLSFLFSKQGFSV